MGIVFLEISMSLDGFVAGPNDSDEQPLGDGGTRLHEWIRSPNEVATQVGTSATLGAIVSGRRTYDLVDGWGGSHPVAHDVVPDVSRTARYLREASTNSLRKKSSDSRR